MRLCVLAAVLSVACAPAFAATTYIKAGRLLDVESGRLLADQAIVIEDARITAIGPAASTPVPAGATVHDLSAKTVLPGLMDAHVHLHGDADLQGYRRLAISLPAAGCCRCNGRR